jgi:alpha-glucuronidase
MKKEKILNIIKDWRTAHPKYRTDKRLAELLEKDFKNENRDKEWIDVINKIFHKEK